MTQGCELAIRDGVVGLPAQIAIRKRTREGDSGSKMVDFVENLFFSFGVIGTAMAVRCSI